MDKVRQALDRARQERAVAADVADAPRAFAERRTLAPLAGGEALQALDAMPMELDAPASHALEAPEQDRVVERSAVFEPDPAVLLGNRVLSPAQEGAAADAFRTLRVQVLQKMIERGWQTIGIASARPGDGRSTVAANLAIAIAADPRHTALLVDLDLRQPRIGQLFGFQPRSGVEAVLRESTQLHASLAYLPSLGALRILPVREPVPASTDLISGASCRALLAELRARYANRIIVVDMPAVLRSDDALLLAPLVDCVLFVAAEGDTRRDDVARAMQLLAPAPVLGTVLNRAGGRSRRA